MNKSKTEGAVRLGEVRDRTEHTEPRDASNKPQRGRTQREFTEMVVTFWLSNSIVITGTVMRGLVVTSVVLSSKLNTNTGEVGARARRLIHI